MKLSLLAIVTWAAGFLGNSVLCTILYVKRRNKVVPWFTAWIIFNLLYTLVLFAAYSAGSKRMYVVFYWSGAFLDLLLQIGIVLEIAGSVFRNGGVWLEGSRRRILLAGTWASLVAALMGWAMTPAAASPLEGLEARVDLAATVLITLLFTSVLIYSHVAGMSWRSLVVREGFGVAVWSLFSFLADTLHGYWRTAEHFTLLEQIRIFVYLGALGYWCVVFWLPEVTIAPMTDEQKNSIKGLLRTLK